MKNYLENYLKNRPFFYIFIRPKEAELFSRFLQFKKPILDFGCGDGFFAETFYKNSGEIDCGIDINKKEIEKAKKIKIYKILKFYDQKKLPFESSYFSTVISNCVMEHVENLEHDLKEINRVTKKGGRFYVSVMTKKWEDYLIGGKIFGKFYKNWMRTKQKHPNLLTKKEWDLAFKKAGFRIIERIGYVDKNTARLIELFHFLSIESLLTYKLFGKWVIFSQRYVLFPSKLISKILLKDINENKSAAIFYALEKT